jgi:NAD(P)-dependent dehydrogenase (short-subunit alcohol dehydrogenase family)
MRTYVVTGSASGIGAATRALLERRGARVVGVDLRDADVIADLSTPTGRAGMIERVGVLVNGKLDGLVACAGVGGGQNHPDKVIRVNYFGAVATLDGLRPLLSAGREPRAAVLGSIALLAGEDEGPTALCLAGDEDGAVAACAGVGPVAYRCSKRAISRWARLAAPTPDWAGAGIALNVVAPGMVLSPMSAYYLGTEELRRQALERSPQPFKGIGKPEDVASLLAWLTGPDNSFVTGQIIFVDGGYEVVQRHGEVPQTMRDLL